MILGYSQKKVKQLRLATAGKQNARKGNRLSISKALGSGMQSRINLLLALKPLFALGALLTSSSLLLLGSCASPTQKLINTHQWHSNYITVNTFQLWLIRNHQNKPTSTLHIYLSGDGQPWLNNKLIAKEPSPRKPVSLSLMALDPKPSLYIGRPCYHLAPGKSQQTPCEPILWTFERYSETVVDTMTKAVQHVAGSVDTITLIGFSGGGVLATLIGERVPKVNTVISVAANLDTQLWTEMMGYSPLKGSLNPNQLGQLRKDVQRIHLIANQDTQVPPPTTRAFAQRHGGKSLEYPNFDHHCCWHTIWEDLIKGVR